MPEEFDPVTQKLVSRPLKADDPEAPAPAEAPAEAPPDPEAPEAPPEPAEGASDAEDAPSDDEDADGGGRELSGLRVILWRDREASVGVGDDVPYALLADATGAPQLFPGDRNEARKAALDDPRNERLADEVRGRPGSIELVAVPASSWSPRPVRARVEKTIWTFA